MEYYKAMPNYTAPVLDMLFILRHVIGEDALKTLTSENLPEGLDSDTAEAVLQEAARLAETKIAPLNQIGDKHPPALNGWGGHNTRGLARCVSIIL